MTHSPDTTDHANWPRDFDFRAEVAEQQELLSAEPETTQPSTEPADHDTDTAC